MDINGLIQHCKNILPNELKGSPWTILGHGRDVLQSEDQLNAYIASYGEMHIIKCKAALQNFPFDSLTNFEIIDWGCGQGLASLTLMDMLKEREKFYGLRRVTLIEPSKIALDRAERILRRFAQTNIEIETINAKIPSDDKNVDFPDFKLVTSCTIHLFSNILDLPCINLKWLANKVVVLGNIQHIVCVGPKFGNNSRISDFCGFFNPETFFSKISESDFGYTSDTHYHFGCETACFTNDRKTINEDYVEKGIYDGYDVNFGDCNYVSESLRGVIDGNIIDVYNVLRNQLGEDTDIFIKPRISTDIPDILVVNKQKGILVVDVCNGTKAEDIENEIDKINNYANNLINLHLKTFKAKSILNKGMFRVVQKAIYFSVIYNEKEFDDKMINLIEERNKVLEQKVNASDALNGKKKHLGLVFSKNELQDSDILKKIHYQYNNMFDQEIYDDIINIVVSNGWHSYKDGDKNLKLTKRQQFLSKSVIGKQKIKGAAGAGKTLVLACRAVNSLVRTGGRVLILTFNITLVNYIRHRMSQVPADFSWNMIDISNYHQFFKSQATNLQAKLKIGDWENISFFEKFKDKTYRYDAVFVDETQDYKEEWLRIITKYFLKDNGEFVVFGDGMQNIYKRDLDAEHQPVIPMIRGSWNEMKEEKNVSFRIENPELVKLASSFQNTFLDYSEPLNYTNTLGFYFVKYWNVGADTQPDKFCSNIRWILQEYKLTVKDVVVLSQSIKILRDIEDVFKRVDNLVTTTTFENKYEYDHITSMDSDYRRKINLDAIRRVKKIHFTTDTQFLKMATIHSFKGWEADNIILILLREGEINNEDDNYDITVTENNPALVYTAITRARKNLFILNRGNDNYHEFFKQNIK